ncbi:hypothetical protein CR513_11827, partial [Mucuna pruriens]
MLHACTFAVISLPVSMIALLEEFKDVFLDDIPSGLPPFRGIKHHINLCPRASLPNKGAYRKNPEEGKEIQKQVGKLLGKGWIRESMSPCVMPVILVPKKDGTWRMNLIPYLAYLLDELHGSQMFSKIDLKSTIRYE